MSREENAEPWVVLSDLIGKRDREGLATCLDGLAPNDVARAISRLEDAEQGRLLLLVGPDRAADLIEELSDVQGADIIEDLNVKQAAAIMEAMESDERADLLGELAPEDVEAILREMRPEEAKEARSLLQYEPDTAGGLMITEFVVYPQHLTVGDVLNDLRSNLEAYSDYGVQYAYVCADSGTLVGVLRLRDLVLSPNDKPISAVMIVNPISVHVDEGLEELEQMFDRYAFSGLPVVNEDGSLIGVVQRADVEEAHSEQSERTFMQFSGIIGGEELRTTSVARRTTQRLSWLAINLVLSILAAFVIIVFEGTIIQISALAALIPVLANVSGCSGNQAVAVSIREMALGLIRPADLARVIVGELAVGIINGIVLGLMLAGFVYVWKSDLLLAGVAAIALALNTVVAVTLGGSIPLVLRYLNIDPSVAAAPMLTTFVDMCGFFLILSLAAYVLL